jgi:hypothetical protein
VAGDAQPTSGRRSSGGRRTATARAIGCIAAVALTGAPGDANGATPAKPASCTLVTKARTVTRSHVFTLKGIVRPKIPRRVALQMRRSHKWIAKARTTSTKSGGFRLRVPTGRVGLFTLRAFAPRSHGIASAACPTITITVKAPGGAPGTDPPPSSGGPKPGNSFRAIYAVAADQSAKPDEIAAIVNDTDVVDAWFGGQTNNGVQPRWIRSKNADGSRGAPVVETVSLPRTAAEYSGDSGVDKIIADLEKVAPTAAPTEKTAVWIDAKSATACGLTSGDVTILLEAACDIYPSTNDTWPYGATYLLAHELTHNFGAVPSCAPHFDGSAHINDDPRDVLFQGQGARDWQHLMLDPGHDDYYDTGRADCPGIEGSPFWTLTSDPSS